MKRVLALFAAFLAIAVAGAPSGGANGPEPVTVGLFGCQARGGAVVPSGAPIVLQAGWSARRYGLVVAFLRGQTTSATVDGAPVVNVETYWGEPEPLVYAGLDSWVTWWRYPTGVALEPGETLHATLVLTLDHQLPDLLVFDGRRPALFSGAYSAHCTITGA